MTQKGTMTELSTNHGLNSKQNKRYKKMPSFFFQELTVLLLICDSYTNRSTRFASQKLFGGFSVLDSVSFLLKYFICISFVFVLKPLTIAIIWAHHAQKRA